MQNERKSSGINIGSASIIMVFSVLCLTVFAVLSLVTANSEYKLAIKSTDVIKNYYSADAHANEKIAAIKTVLEKEGLESATKEASKLNVSLKNEAEGLEISFDEQISDSQKLTVNAVLNNGQIKVNEWKTVPTKDWNSDENNQFWDGEF